MRFRTQLAVAAVVVSALAVGSLLGGVLGDGGRSAAAPAVPVDASFAADRALTGIAAAGGTDTRELERAVRERPDDAQSLVLLGYAYQQRWRETADASNLPRSEAALRRASRLDPTDSLAVIGLGSLALIRHDFRSALAIGRRAERLAPSSARTYGLVGDSLLELGRYEDAFRAFERMIALRPSVASYARIAYARELLGDLDGARAAMQLAADAASGQREPAAWANVELAKLDLRAGRLPRAERHLRVALELVPGYVFAAEQLARLEAARGNLPRAIRLAQRAAAAVPLPQFVSLLADLHARSGNRVAAERQVETVGAIDRILVANGVRTDVESAVFDADHRIGAATLVARARVARADRPSILGDDALGWALARTGRCDEARTWSERSLRLGTQDALLFFHRAEIERCAGDRLAARRWARKALALDPAFSVRWAPAARRLAA
jgi:tetratricopeptide (TPR) repeat protein